MKPPKPRYEIQSGKFWIPCKKAAERKPGWLHYELADGTVGLTKKWRKIVKTILSFHGEEYELR